MMLSQAKGCLGATRCWERQGRMLSQRIQRDHGPVNTLIFRLWPPKLRENKFILFLATRCVVFCYGRPRKLIYPLRLLWAEHAKFLQLFILWYDLCPFLDFLPRVYFMYQANCSRGGLSSTSYPGDHRLPRFWTLTQHTCFPGSFFAPQILTEFIIN